MAQEDDASGDGASLFTELVNATVGNDTTADGDMGWAGEWLGYIALCMFSMVLLIPTLGIVCLMVWEYFSDEAERKNERQKEIEHVMRKHYFPKEKTEGDKDEDEDDDYFDKDEDDRDLRDVDEVLQQAETLLHKRKRVNVDPSPENFDQILT